MIITTLIGFFDILKKAAPKGGSENYFRGHSNANFGLTPSIYRDSYISNEHKIFREAIIRSPQEFSPYKSTIEKLVKMQHYGIPTRLLDITSNPLVALFFACNKDEKHDGEVIFLQIPDESIKFYDSDTISILSNIAKRPKSFEYEQIEGTPISDFNTLYHIEYLLHDIKDEKPYFQNIINQNHLNKVFAVKVKLDNPRILKQNGAFLLFGVRGNKQLQAEVPLNWQESKHLGSSRIIIKAKSKRSILSALDILGINESTLFPELENQAKYIKEAYIAVS